MLLLSDLNYICCNDRAVPDALSKSKKMNSKTQDFLSFTDKVPKINWQH